MTMPKRTRKQNRPAPVRRSQRKTVAKKAKTPREQFHPGRREHAEQFIEALADTPSQAFATSVLDHLWWNKPAPKKPRALSVARVKEIDAALYAIFSTVR